MILEIPTCVKIDGNDVIGNIRANFPNKSQARLKFDVFVDGQQHAIDVSATSIRYSIGLGGATVNLVGKENGRNIPFNLQLEYKLVKKVTCISGLAGGKQINKTLNSKQLPIALAEIGKIFIA